MTTHHILEAAFAGAIAFATAASTLLMSQPAEVVPTVQVVQSAMELRLIMVPLIGGAFTMLGGVFLNPSVETVQIKIGRACIGMFAAVVAPQILGWFHPMFKDVGTNPFMLFMAGGISAFLGFMLSRAIVQGIDSRSGRMAANALDRAEAKYIPKPPVTDKPPQN